MHPAAAAWRAVTLTGTKVVAGFHASEVVAELVRRLHAVVPPAPRHHLRTISATRLSTMPQGAVDDQSAVGPERYVLVQVSI